MDSLAVQYDILSLLLPPILFAVLAIVVALTGISRWRPMAVASAVIGIASLVAGALLYHNSAAATAQAALLDTAVTQRQIIATAALRCGIALNALAAFYTLIVAARASHWGWFILVAFAALVSAAAGVLLLAPTIVFDLLTDQQRAHDVASASLYTPLATTGAGLALLAVLIYALLGAPTVFARVAARKMSQDVTQP